MADVTVDPDQLQAAARGMTSAAKADGQAQREFGTAAEPGQSVFGVSGQARALLQQWADAAHSRAFDADQLAKRTSDMSTLLAQDANNYQQTDESNATSVASAGSALDRS
jgi:hypothetical protein